MDARVTRRRAVTRFAAWLAGSPLAGEVLVGEPAGRIAPVNELVNAFEFAAMAERQLGSATFERLAGSDRRAFDRITLRPRMMVNTLNLDLTTELFGESMFAPILVGPVSDQGRFHAEGELATVRGASAAKAVMVISSHSTCPLEQIVAPSPSTFWFQVYPEPDLSMVRMRIDKAVDLGCKAVCITIGAPEPTGGNSAVPLRTAAMDKFSLDWTAIDRLRNGLRVPVLLKGLMSPEEARTAVARGISGVVVSDHAGLQGSARMSPIEALPSIAKAVGGKVPILIDGGFRRGTDILKGLALGAGAILLGRPPMWGLAAYGADGVRTLLTMLQTELARDMAMCGSATAAEVDSRLVTLHQR